MQSFLVFSMQFYLILSLTLGILVLSPEYFCHLSPPISAAATNVPPLPFEVTNPPTSPSHVQEKKEGVYTDKTILNTGSNAQPLYPKVTNPTFSPSYLQELPGFIRSVSKKDHALISPKDQVFSPLPRWTNTSGAYLITHKMGSDFVMYLAKMQENSKSGTLSGFERIVFVVDGAAVIVAFGSSHNLNAHSYAYFPPNSNDYLKCEASATLVIIERSCREYCGKNLIVNSTDKQPLVEAPGEDFELRKLFPTSGKYEFNIHVMDFQPGEFLNVKEFRHNQHGLLLLEGLGIYRLGDSWYPVHADDVIWIAPYVPQWYAALGKSRSRFLLYKDVANSMQSCILLKSTFTYGYM